MKGLKYVYTLFLLLFLGGIGYFVACSHKADEKKHIVLINSYNENHTGYGNFKEILRQNLERLKISADIDILYLECDTYLENEEIDRMYKLFDSLDSEKVDLILMINDPAAYSGLKTNHPILKQVPVILVNINYPNESVLAPYANDRVYVLRDTPEFIKNIDFIKKLHGNEVVEITYNLEFTFLGNQSLQNLLRSVNNDNIRIVMNKWELTNGSIYSELNEKLSIMNLDKYVFSKATDLSKDFVIRMAPFRHMNGVALLNLISITRSYQSNTVFLLDRIDLATRSLPQLLGMPSFSCVRESFNENSKVVGGYMSTDELSAKATANLAKKLMFGEGAKEAKIQDLEKEYVLDWNVLSLYNVYKINNVPSNVRLINYPIYEKYKNELYAVGVIFVIAFIVLVISLMSIYRHVLAERQSIKVLKKMHKQLSRSISGGNITTWLIKDEELEFDDNFTKLSGLQCHKFEFKEFIKYHYVDDISLVIKVIKDVRISHDMLIQRVRLRFCGDKYEWYEIRCSSFVNRIGNVIIAGIIQNINNIVEREKELIRAKEIAEKAELKQSFLTNMSHEIRTPLNAIVGFTNILAGEDAADLEASEKEEMIALVNSNSELLLKLISDVLDISRLDSNNLAFAMDEYDLVPLIKEIYSTHQIIIHKSLDFKLVIDDSVPMLVKIDKLRFTQVISNLLNNANKFTETGFITLGCHVDDQHKKVIVYVEDSGKGIAADQQKIIFDRFYKTDEFAQGTGLGLSISKVIMERLSGEITIQSKQEEGSRFIVTLPLVAFEKAL